MLWVKSSKKKQKIRKGEALKYCNTNQCHIQISLVQDKLIPYMCSPLGRLYHYSLQLVNLHLKWALAALTQDPSEQLCIWEIVV